MASISGISVKGLKKFLGHEGEPLFQGNIYLNGKKIGFWSQDSHGGPDNFMLEDGYKQEKMLNDALAAMYPEKAMQIGTPDKPAALKYDLELLMMDLLDLVEAEKAFKNAVKDGYGGILIVTDGYHQTTWKLPAAYTALSNEDLLNKMCDDIDRVKEGFFPEDDFKKHVTKVYRSLDNFILGEAIDFGKVDSLIKNAKQRTNNNVATKEEDYLKD